MSSRNPPPWERNGRDRPPQRPPPSSTIPAKRSADSRPHDNASKRSTNAAEEAWVADEDRFVLQQAKKKAALRVKGGRAKPIDWLAVTLRFIDPTKSIHDEEVEDHELDVVDPEGVLEGLDADGLSDLEKEIENYLALETHRGNREYWSVSRHDSRDKGKALIFTGPQDHLQRPPPQVESGRLTQHQLRLRRHRQAPRPEDIRTTRNTRGASQKEARLR
jgi:hypothetical protein